MYVHNSSKLLSLKFSGHSHIRKYVAIQNKGPFAASVFLVLQIKGQLK